MLKPWLTCQMGRYRLRPRYDGDLCQRLHNYIYRREKLLFRLLDLLYMRIAQIVFSKCI